MKQKAPIFKRKPFVLKQKAPVFKRKTLPPPHCPHNYRKTCLHPGCGIQPIYGKIGTKLREYCKDHCPEEGYQDVVNKTCLEPGCDTLPIYGKIGTKLKEYCKDHCPEEGYQNVINKPCLEPGCDTKPSYGKIGTKLKEYCKAHCPEEGYQDVANKTCLEPGCDIQPTYGKIGTKVPEYCKDHCPEEGYQDVKNKTCSEPGCDTRTSYGFAGHPRIYCAQHKIQNTMKFSNSKCKTSKCKKPAFYGFNIPTHCEEHKTEDEIDMIQKKCLNCGLIEIVNQGQICAVCDPSLLKKVRLAKQKNVKAHLDLNGIKYQLYDKIIDSACGLDRPDFLFDTTFHAIVLEIDEHQNLDRTNRCELVRMQNIANSLMRPTLFIRFNPDKYKPIKGQRIKNEQDRLKSLIFVLKHWNVMNDKLEPQLPSDKLTFCNYLYYGGYDSTKWNEIAEVIVQN